MKFYMFIAMLLSLLTSCSNTEYELTEPIGGSALYDESELWHPEGDISRTDDFESKLFGIVVIDTAEEYREYFGDIDTIYTEEYFSENALIASSITESSGSIELEYVGVDADNNIIIRRTVPEVGTCDMAEYTLIIEIPFSRADTEYGMIYDTTYEY